MTDNTRFWIHAGRLPFVPASRIHLAGLEALARGEWEAADALFERAAHGYRRTARVECIARLRVHQLITRIMAHGVAASSLVIEVEQRLARLDTIESLTPPHEQVPARALMAGWRDMLAGFGAADDESLRRAA